MSGTDKGCSKAYFLEGWLQSFVRQVKYRFLKQDACVQKLEDRVIRLEAIIAAISKDKT